MKRLIQITGMLALSAFLGSCDSPSSYQTPPTTNVVVNEKASLAGEGLDLKAVGELVKNCKDAPELEKKLNDPTTSVNNLDLNKDGQVDYIKVTEYGSGNTRGFSLTTEPTKGDVQELATIDIQKNQQTQQAEMSITGNQDVYGSNQTYQSSFSPGEFLLMAWLFSPRPYYVSPYYFGYYPAYYHPWGCYPYYAYHSRAYGYYGGSRTVYRTTTTYRSTVASPNSGRSSSTFKSNYSNRSSLSSPTSSNKSFSSRSSGKSVGSGGFRSSSSSSHSSSGFHSSGRSSFGGSRSSFGGGRRSDSAFKKDVVPLRNSLEKVTSLKGVRYHWKTKEFPDEKFDSTAQMGFIAQDLEKVYPELVKKRTDGKRTVDYDLLVPALVEAIKELKNTVDKQQKQIEKLKAGQEEENKVVNRHILKTAE